MGDGRAVWCWSGGRCRSVVFEAGANRCRGVNLIQNPQPAASLTTASNASSTNVRLSILSSLAAHPGGLLFTELKTLCALTDGNLSRQLSQLQEGRFVETWKGLHNNRPQTLVKLTDAGRKRFLDYIGVLEGLVADALANTETGRIGNVGNAGPARSRLSTT